MWVPRLGGSPHTRPVVAACCGAVVAAACVLANDAVLLRAWLVCMLVCVCVSEMSAVHACFGDYVLC